MYKSIDNYNDTYYFYGAVENNWLYFNNNYWRIIRVNGDGSVRVQLSLYSPTEATKVHALANTQIAPMFLVNYASSYVTFDNSNLYSGADPSLMNLNNWYDSDMAGIESLMADNLFCATDLEQDNFTCDISYAYVQNTSQYASKSFNKKIGLLSLVDAKKIGLINSNNEINTQNYLYYPVAYWLMPNEKDLSSIDLNSAKILIPVLNIRGDLTIKSGSGSFNDPFRINAA